MKGTERIQCASESDRKESERKRKGQEGRTGTSTTVSGKEEKRFYFKSEKKTLEFIIKWKGWSIAKNIY